MNIFRINQNLFLVVFSVLSLLCFPVIGSDIQDSSLDISPTLFDTIIVDDDGGGDYTSIQAAVDNASEGDVILVWDGIYFENITINKTLEIRGNHSSATILNGIGQDNTVVTIFANNVSFSGFTIQQGNFLGINIVGSQNVIVTENIVTNNTYGIWILFGSKNIITHNIIQYQEEQGLSISLGFLNHITENTFLQNSVGKEVDHAFFWNSFHTTWDDNYWDNHEGTGPKRVQGQINPFFTVISNWIF